MSVISMPKRVQDAFFYYTQMDKPSYEQLSQDKNIPFGTVKKWAEKYNWRERAEEHWRKQFEQSQKEIINVAATKGKDIFINAVNKAAAVEQDTIHIQDVKEWKTYVDSIKTISEVLTKFLDMGNVTKVEVDGDLTVTSKADILRVLQEQEEAGGENEEESEE